MALLLVLNLHGAINSSGPVRKALEELKVVRRFSASVVPGDASTLGTLKLCKDHVAWAPVDADLLATLLKKRGMVSTTKALDSASLKKMGYKDHDDLASKMIEGEDAPVGGRGPQALLQTGTPQGRFQTIDAEGVLGEGGAREQPDSSASSSGGCSRLPTRTRKSRKYRGSRTHGYGQIGQHRHSGSRGGHGNAGLHKHKWSWFGQVRPRPLREGPLQTAGLRKAYELGERGRLGHAREWEVSGPDVDGSPEAPRFGHGQRGVRSERRLVHEAGSG